MKLFSSIKKYLTDMRTAKYDKFILLGFIWIWLISMLDHYATIKLQHDILENEKNPLGTFLINIDSGSVALFMTVKMICLWFIACIILSIYQENKVRAYLSIVALGMCQLLLLLYFIWGHHLL